MKYDDFIVGETFKTKAILQKKLSIATTFDPQYAYR